MNLEDQVCSFELAKQLNELGVKQESLFYWCRFLGTDILGSNSCIVLVYGADKSLSGLAFERLYFALTVAELGEILKNHTSSFPKYDAPRSIWYLNFRGGVPIHKDFKTEADAKAELLIYLIKNKILSI